eukprot:TRINITY_DN1241_c0_g1_i1.p3 TRINITY_DN1241_c0_g1~~TRINITY_DN1241_c0_g1_i1.p3  ORF type:complete len:102 (+),score=10.13 TRINITY_DN1241_c0_g1_i1:494-799(+)
MEISISEMKVKGRVVTKLFESTCFVSSSMQPVIKTHAKLFLRKRQSSISMGHFDSTWSIAPLGYVLLGGLVHYGRFLCEDDMRTEIYAVGKEIVHFVIVKF